MHTFSSKLWTYWAFPSGILSNAFSKWHPTSYAFAAPPLAQQLLPPATTIQPNREACSVVSLARPRGTCCKRGYEGLRMPSPRALATCHRAWAISATLATKTALSKASRPSHRYATIFPKPPPKTPRLPRIPQMARYSISSHS